MQLYGTIKSSWITKEAEDKKSNFSVQCDNIVVMDEDENSSSVPSVQYLLGLDRRGTYVVRESVEKVENNCICIKVLLFLNNPDIYFLLSLH